MCVSTRGPAHHTRAYPMTAQPSHGRRYTPPHHYHAVLLHTHARSAAPPQARAHPYHTTTTPPCYAKPLPLASVKVISNYNFLFPRVPLHPRASSPRASSESLFGNETAYQGAAHSLFPLPKERTVKGFSLSVSRFPFY